MINRKISYNNKDNIQQKISSIAQTAKINININDKVNSFVEKIDIRQLQNAINTLEANFANNCCESNHCQTCQSDKCESCQDSCTQCSSKCESCQDSCTQCSSKNQGCQNSCTQCSSKNQGCQNSCNNQSCQTQCSCYSCSG